MFVRLGFWFEYSVLLFVVLLPLPSDSFGRFVVGHMCFLLVCFCVSKITGKGFQLVIMKLSD